jgi:RNA polymerase sigma factor for flagellar operon FliA
MAEPSGVDQLIHGAQGMVRMLAVQIHRRMPAFLELDDLVSYGQLGLVQAAKDFRPELGNKFSTYAYYRIRGAIYDGAIKMSWMNRGWHRHTHLDALAGDYLQNDAQESTDQESAESGCGWLQRVAGSMAVVYLASRSRSDESGAPEIEDEHAETPQTAIARRELSERLHRLLDEMPAETAQLIRYVYFEEMTLQDAGVRLGISKSWASRLHARALEQLARGLRDLDLAL